MRIQESAEDYLETILILKNRNGAVRSIDVATELQYSKPSVSVAMKNLRENGCIVVDEDGFITLTKNGYEIAEKMYERHMLISEWLVSLGVDKDIAVHDACKMEHAMSEQSFSAIKRFVKDWNESADRLARS